MSITVKIDDELNDWIEKMKKKKKFRNRTHAVEYCITFTKEHDAALAS